VGLGIDPTFAKRLISFWVGGQEYVGWSKLFIIAGYASQRKQGLDSAPVVSRSVTCTLRQAISFLCFEYLDLAYAGLAITLGHYAMVARTGAGPRIAGSGYAYPNGVRRNGRERVDVFKLAVLKQVVFGISVESRNPGRIQDRGDQVYPIISL